MGHDTVTGKISIVRDDNSGFTIMCNETGSFETVDIGDGDITILD